MIGSGFGWCSMCVCMRARVRAHTHFGRHVRWRAESCTCELPAIIPCSCLIEPVSGKLLWLLFQRCTHWVRIPKKVTSKWMNWLLLICEVLVFTFQCGRRRCVEVLSWLHVAWPWESLVVAMTCLNTQSACHPWLHSQRFSEHVRYGSDGVCA